MDHKNLDMVMRFEQLGDDFAVALEKIGIEQIRPLPLFNKTGKKEKHFTEYFESDEAKKRAIKVFGPYMEEWGYSFPESWNVKEMPSKAWYDFVNIGRKVYWRYLR